MIRLAALTCLLAATSVAAQDAPPPLSPQCEAPNADIASPAPLPRLASRLAAGGPLRILTVGSSANIGLSPATRRRTYSGQLQAILQAALHGVKADIVTRGVSGEMAQTTAERLRTGVALEQPDVVLWQLGTADALARVAPEDFENIVSDAVTWLKANNIDVVLVGFQYAPRFLREANYYGIREALQRVAAKQNILYVRRDDAMQFIAKSQDHPGMIAGDDANGNSPGYQCMAEHVAHAVIVNLFSRKQDLPKTDVPKPDMPKADLSRSDAAPGN